MFKNIIIRIALLLTSVILFSGCYTQLAMSKAEPEDEYYSGQNDTLYVEEEPQTTVYIYDHMYHRPVGDPFYWDGYYGHPYYTTGFYDPWYWDNYWNLYPVLVVGYPVYWPPVYYPSYPHYDHPVSRNPYKERPFGKWENPKPRLNNPSRGSLDTNPGRYDRITTGGSLGNVGNHPVQNLPVGVKPGHKKPDVSSPVTRPVKKPDVNRPATDQKRKENAPSKSRPVKVIKKDSKTGSSQKPARNSSTTTTKDNGASSGSGSSSSSPKRDKSGSNNKTSSGNSDRGGKAVSNPDNSSAGNSGSSGSPARSGSSVSSPSRSSSSGSSGNSSGRSGSNNSSPARRR